MRLGLNLGYWGLGLKAEDQLELVREAEDAGFDSVWAAEAYGSDAATVLAWLAAQTARIKLGSAIFQMPARSPAMTAMTAATLDQLSGGRVLLGIGSSGPQVAEGWHGQRFGEPAPAHARVRGDRAQGARPRAARVRRRAVHAPAARRPGQGAQADDRAGAGADPDLHRGDRAEEHRSSPARSPTAGCRSSSRPSTWASRAELLEEGAARSGRTLDGSFDIAPSVNVCIDDDVDRARDQMRHFIALYVGGMGSREKNFYNALVQRYGFEEAAQEVQDLYLDGKKDEAAAALPAELIDTIALVGPRDKVRDRLAVYRDAGVGTLIVSPLGVRARGEHADGARAGGDALSRALPARGVRRSRVTRSRRSRSGPSWPVAATTSRSRPGPSGASTWSARACASAAAPEYQVFPTRERPLKPYEAAVRASAVTRELIREVDPELVVADILTVAAALAAELEERPWATLVPHVLPTGEPGFPLYSVGAVYPRSALGRAAWGRTRPLLMRGEEQGRRELNETRRRVGLPPLAHVQGGISQRARAGGDLPAARVPARAAPARRARDRPAALGAALRRGRAAARRRAARAGRAQHLAGSGRAAPARRPRRPRGRARARARDPPTAARRRTGCRCRRTPGSSTGSPTRARCRSATPSSATPGTARSRGRWPAACRWWPARTPATWRRTRPAFAGRAWACRCRAASRRARDAARSAAAPRRARYARRAGELRDWAAPERRRRHGRGRARGLYPGG